MRIDFGKIPKWEIEQETKTQVSEYPGRILLKMKPIDIFTLNLITQEGSTIQVALKHKYFDVYARLKSGKIINLDTSVRDVQEMIAEESEPATAYIKDEHLYIDYDTFFIRF